MALEAQLITDSGTPEVQLTYTNATGSSISITNHEIFSITSDTNKDVACMALASTDVATIGTCANGETMQALIGGRIRVNKSTAVDFAIGASVYWDAGNNTATTKAVAAAADDFCLGMCVKTAATAATEVDVDMNEGPQSYYQGNT